MKNATKEKVLPETITIRKIEYFQTYISRESAQINLSDYPELDGKSEEEIQSYINENSWEMAPPPGNDWADSLGDFLSQQDIIREKISGEGNEIIFE